MQVYNNTTAFNVWRNYTANVTGLRSSMNKLSTGLRITNAGDDPSGLAMSERLRTQYRNTAAAAGNVENKINYLQTADAWLQKIHDMMGRMSELAVMANDGTKSQVDRDNLQKEFQQMQKEITRITSGATASGKFNGNYLFRGGTGVPMLQGDVVQGHVKGSFSLSRVSGSATLAGNYSAAYNMDDEQWTVRNTDTDSVVGTINASYREGGELFINEGGNVFRFAIDPPQQSGYQNGCIIEFNNTALQPAHASPPGYTAQATQGSALLSVRGDGSDISTTSWRMTYTGSAWELVNAGTGQLVRTVSSAPNGAVSIPGLEGGNGFDFRINSPSDGTCYTIGDSFTWGNRNGHVGTPQFQNMQSDVGSSSIAILGDGLNNSTADYEARYDSTHQRWIVQNQTSGSTEGFIHASPLSGGSLTLNGGNGFRLSIASPVNGGYSEGDTFAWSVHGSGDDYELNNAVSLQVGPDSNQVFTEEQINLEAQNFDIIGSYMNYSYGSVNMTLLGSSAHTIRWGSLLAGNHLSISEQSFAQAAVDKLNLGIDHLSSIRATLGAELNRMGQTLDGLRTYEENARATESRIRDTDVAHETTQYSKYQILVQIGTAMMAQANTLTQSVLQLMG